MKKRLVLTGIISLLLVFGMMIISCGNKDDPSLLPDVPVDLGTDGSG